MGVKSVDSEYQKRTIISYPLFNPLPPKFVSLSDIIFTRYLIKQFVSLTITLLNQIVSLTTIFFNPLVSCS